MGGGRGRDGRSGRRRDGKWEAEGWEVGGRGMGSRRGRDGRWEGEGCEVGGKQGAVEPYLCHSVFTTQLYVSDSSGERWNHVSERVVLAEL